MVIGKEMTSAPERSAKRSRGREKETEMQWTMPMFEEVDLACEIGSYANAEI
jgi:hypothetical protein